MTMILRALTHSGAAAVVSMSPVSSALLLLGHVVSGMVSLDTKVASLLLIYVGLLWPLQGVLVGKRRCSGHWFVQYPAMVAYYLPSPLAIYTLNAVCSTSTSHLDESLIIAISIHIVLIFLALTQTSCHYMRAYSLRDGPHNPLRFILSIFYLACVEWEWTRISSENGGIVMQAFIPDLEWARNNRGLVPLLLNMTPYISFLLALMFSASKTPESTLDYETKAVAEYMRRESKSSSPFFDDGDADAKSSLQLDSCRYPFGQRRKDGQWISIKDLFHQCPDLPSKDKDIWLSYSFSRLLARRYYGFHCAEEGDDKVRRFALADLGRTDGYKKAFTSVEVQLAFLYDNFFTTYPRIIQSSLHILPNKMRMTIDWTLLVCGLIIGVLCVVGQYNDWFPIVPGRTMRYGPPVIVIISSALWLSTSEQRLLPNYWLPVHIVFHKLYILRPPTTIIIWARSLVHIFYPNELDVYRPLQTQTSTDCWRDKIGQYSLLLDYNRHRSPKKALIAWFLGLVRSQPRYKFIKHLPAEEKDVRVPNSVRKLVADTLWAIDGPPTNGTRSLKINMNSSVYDWSWTCRQETHTGTILIWHIATCYCDMSRRHSDQPDDDFPLPVETNTFEVATALSRYCAYLVAFLPEFLLEHNLITKEVFQNTIQDAHGALGSTHLEEKEKLTKIQKLELPPQDCQRIFHKGVRLGRQLEELDVRLRWKVMAEFWAETILYVMPSDNAEAHIERLAKGGEFVTHLWAMLSNAGILKRATEEWHQSLASTTTEGPPTHQLTEALSSSNDDEASTSSMSYPQIQISEAPRNDEGNQTQILEDLDQEVLV